MAENGNSVVSNSVIVEKLRKRFGSFVAVERLDLSVRKGEVFGFLGPNGAGKSTTIRMLCGLLRPTSGPRDRRRISMLARKPEAVRQNIGYMSQKFSLYNDLKVIENLRLFAGLYSVPANILRERIDWALEMANLKGQENLITGTLPGGWKQRLALGCAVLHRPPILFLDEPTSGVDPDLAAAILGPDSPDGRRRRNGFCDYALHGRGRVLQPAGADLSRADGGAGHADGAEARFYEGRVASGEVRTARTGD